MRSRLEATSSALRSPFPWIALSAALAVTAATWLGVERSRREEARNQFERRTETAAAAVRARMLAYEQILRSGAAYVASAPGVSRDDWRRFVRNLELDERFPGIQALGFAELQRGPASVEKVPVLYVEPATSRNVRVIGFDMYAEPARHAAIDKVRDTGEVAITARLTLAGEAYRGAQPPQPGFVMYAPVYHEHLRELPRAERRNAVAGFVFAPFRMQDLVRGILDEGVLAVLDMRIFDEADGGRQQALIDTRSQLRAEKPAPATFERVMHFPMPGRNWTIQFVSRPEFDAGLATDRPWIVLGGGVLASTVVFLLVTALMEAWNQAHNQSMRDPLTGLFNRRYLEETMGREVPRALRVGGSIGVIVLDLDHFKRLNDTHGHDAGDFVLARMGELLKNASRGSDIACRFGGEEFGLILPGAALQVTRARADAIRAAFQSIAFEFDGVALGSFTLSAGVAALSHQQSEWPVARRDADRALYAAKAAGRNCVKSADELPPPSA